MLPTSPLMASNANFIRLGTRLSWLVIAFLWLMAALVKWVGTDGPLIAPLVYAPKLFPGLGFVVIAILGWRWEKTQLAGAGLVSAMLWFVPVLEWRPPGPTLVASGKTLSVLTCNRGQNDGHTLGGWMLHRQPDVMVFQDAFAPDAYVMDAADYVFFPHQRRVGEHVLLSRHPILAAAPADREAMIRRGSNWHYLPAVRFVVDWEGVSVVVWSIHVRSPRDQFRNDRGRLRQRLGLPISPQDAAAIQSVDWGGSYWDEQRLSVEALLELIHADAQPTVIAGDWNIPDVGPLYWKLTKRLADAHREAGSGYGYTFPGDLNWWAAFGQPWLRIDYVLTDHHWRPLTCEVEPSPEGSQHHALFAELEFRP